MASPDSVSFIGILKNYPPGEKLEVSYTLQEAFTSASRDWVGLFRVGWSSSRDYYTFEWAPTPTDHKGTVAFAGRRLPPEDKHFYQFCFVSSDGRVRGASSPFQFTVTAAGDHVEDLELVEIAEDSLMIIQSKDVLEVEQKNEEASKTILEEELVSVKESFTKLEAEKEVLVNKYEEDCAKKSEELEKMEVKVTDLERQLQAKRDSETRLMEKLEKERALVHELTAAKSNEESQVKVLREQLSGVEATIRAQQAEMENKGQRIEELEAFMKELEQRNKALCGELDQGKAELDQLREVQVKLMSQIGEKNNEIEQTMSKLTEMEERNVEEEKKSRTEKDQLLQEVAIAQQNIAELLGAKKQGVEVATYTAQEPPTLPVTHMAMVDRSAYEALQQAYENIEQMYHNYAEENRVLRSRIHDRRGGHEGCQRKVTELTHRIEQCRVEYEAKCKELYEAKKQMGSGGFPEKVAVLQNKLSEMEENQEQVTKSLDSALQELASRKAELKQKDVALSEAESQIRNLGEALELIKEEYRQFQDKHDEVANEKLAKLDQHEDTIRAQVSEIAELRKERTKLTHTVAQLREQLQGLKQQAKSTERACPVCDTKFPGRISQNDFEKHVQGHFR